MLDVLLSAISFLPVKSDAAQKIVVLNGIEAVLSGGCHGAATLDDNRLHRKVTSTLGARAAAGDAVADHFLEASLLLDRNASS
jgi:hypothetical protein